jgi:tetratricopeptide (TPR) repeat protein
MNSRHLAGWLLAASVLLTVPGGMLVPPLRPAQAQINPVLRGQKFLLWAVWLTRDESYAVAEQLYRDGFETWGRQDVTARLNPQQKESIRIFQMFAESNQRLLQASQQSTTALKNEQKAFERLWQRYQGWLNRTEADLEQARGIPLFAGTAGVPKLQKLLVVGGRVELAQRNAPTQGSGSPQVGAVSPRNVTPTPASQTSERRKVPTTVGQSPQPILAQRNQGDNFEALLERAAELTQQGKYAEAEPLYQRALAILNQALTELSPQQRQAIRRQVQGLVALAGINRGLLLASQGRHGEAKQMFQESLGVLEQALGRNHPDVIKMRQAFTTYAQQQQQARQTTPQVSPQRPTGQSFALQEAYRLNELGMEQYRKAQYAQALESFQRSLAIREQALGANHPDVAQSLHNLAFLYQAQGQYSKAEPLYQRSLAIYEQALGANHPDVAVSLNNLAGLYHSQGQYSKAEPLYQRSLAIREQALGANHPDVAVSLDNLAGLYRSQGQYSKAEPLYQRSLAILEQALGANHPDVATALNNLAVLYEAQGQYSKAEPLYQRSLAIYEQALGANHPNVAVSLNNLAVLYVNQGQYSKAEPLYQRSLAIREQALGANHPNVAVSLNNLALLYVNQGQYSKAEPLVQRSLAILEQALGANHPDVAQSLNNLAGLYERQGQYSKAEPLYQRSLAIREQALGANHPDVATTLNNLAALYQAQGQYSKAEPLYQRSLVILEQALGANHPNVALALNNLAVLYEAQGQYSKAEPLYQRSLAIREQALGANHPDVASSLNNLAVLYHSQGQYSKAEPLVQRSLAIREQALGANHPDVAQSLHNLAALYEAQGQYSKAEPLYQRSLAIREQALGANHPDVAQSLNNLANLYQDQGQYSKAEPLYQRSLAIREQALGANHPDVATALNNLAVLYWSQNQTEPALTRLARALDIEETNLAQNLVIGSEEDKRAYLKTFSGSTHSAISFHLQFAPTNPQAARLALTTILRRKGRVLDTLSQALIRLRQQLSPADQERLTRLSVLRTQVAQIAFNPNPTDQQRQQLQLLNTQAEQIEAELNRSSSAFAQTTQKVTLEAVQKAIPANAALVEFIEYYPFNPKAPQGQRWGSPRYAVYVLSATGEPRWADLGSASEIDALVAQYRSATLDPRRPLSETQAAARTLSAKIMAPVRQFVGTANHLLIAPDGQLNLVAFAGLVDEKNQYLIETYQITYLTSGRDLLRLQTAPPKANPPLIVANPTFDKPGTTAIQIASADRSNPRSGDLAALRFGPLPGTAVEGEAIARLLPNARLFTQTQATEAVVKGTPNPRILHLATHGFFLKPAPVTPARDGSQPLPSENPLLRSGLALAGFNVRQGGGDDGVLTALEMTGMDLRGTQLVVLSACETGLGDVQSGEGVYGLRRALTLAGAQAQVMSLWRVDDEKTKDLMVAYYQRLSKGEPRGEALRQTQLALLRNPQSAHPRDWSGFIFTGDWRAMSP